MSTKYPVTLAIAVTRYRPLVHTCNQQSTTVGGSVLLLEKKLPEIVHPAFVQGVGIDEL